MASFSSLHHFFCRIYSSPFILVVLAATTVAGSLTRPQIIFANDERGARLDSLAPAPSPPCTKESPQAVYDGGYRNASTRGVALRIANGGAGQVGLIKAWADAFIQYAVQKEGEDPFQVCLLFLSTWLVVFSPMFTKCAGCMVSWRYN